MGIRGPPGTPAPTIRHWEINRTRYTVTPILSDGTRGSELERKVDPTLPFAARAIEHPLQELNAEEAAIWTDIIARAPEHFTPPTALLVNLVRHIRMARWFAHELQDYEAQLPHAHNEERTRLLRDIMALGRAQSNQSRIIALLSARLKLTPSAAHARRAMLAEQRPWDIPNSDEELPQ